MPLKVAKFGGTSLANAAQFKKVKDILQADDSRIVAVPSAPGKRFKDDIKVTDMLIGCYQNAQANKDITPNIQAIASRFIDIKDALDIDIDIAHELDIIQCDIKTGASEDYVKSRGEYLSGKMMAKYLGWQFVDPKDVIKFENPTTLDKETTFENIRQATDGHKTVFPGYFGSDKNGNIVTFSRGGSDITGALVAAALDVDVYENWTDVSGFYMADPRIVDDVIHIREISYEELRELSYMGAGVLHEDSIFPVRSLGIPINIKNTNKPQDEGTNIVSFEKLTTHDYPIIGVAGKRGFSIINVKKASMNSELGFGRRILSVLEDLSISFEHMPTGIDTISIVVSDEFLKGKQDAVMTGIKKSVAPDSVEIISDMALIATCGHGMVHHLGTAAKLFTALAQNGINIRMIDQGSSELNIIVGIESNDYEKAVRAIYSSFVQ